MMAPIKNQPNGNYEQIDSGLKMNNFLTSAKEEKNYRQTKEQNEATNGVNFDKPSKVEEAYASKPCHQSYPREQ